MGVVWWWLLGVSDKWLQKHRGNTTDGDEVVANYTHTLSLCVVCPGQRQSFLELSVILKKAKMEKRKSENPA